MFALPLNAPPIPPAAGECRVGTVLFLGFPSLLEPPPRTGSGTARTGLGAVQACMEVVQKRMRQHDGSFLQASERASCGCARHRSLGAVPAKCLL